MKRFAHQPTLFSKNHDSIAIEPVLEACVVRFLINESVVVRKGRESFTPRGRGRHRALSCSDLERAFTGRESGLTALLNHSPTEYREAAGGGRLSHRAHPRWPDLPARQHPTYVQLLNAAPSGFGAWRYRNMIGYTSRGVGSSMVRVRFNCRPEIVVHELAVR